MVGQQIWNVSVISLSVVLVAQSCLCRPIDTRNFDYILNIDPAPGTEVLPIVRIHLTGPGLELFGLGWLAGFIGPELYESG
jgi:hypothetical protein